ncbi:hypothetical protein OS493_021802 [Desmophyllum pertusum]|uniref:beta-N-acetylhexosaminidase n=1 Tax=Desmophyllum pertusum TaxID=174260 RepID=A0A9W9ZNT3_9CNID|nr:hypothetical protein OS493_021802 [Desmophyllum pertusum]
MKIMRINYTNVGIAVSLLVVSFIFFKLSQLKNHSRTTSITLQTTGRAVEPLIKDKAADLFDDQLQKAQDTLESLKRELVLARKDTVKENRMDQPHVDKKKRILRFNGQRLVHLDLKGAPTKMDYLIQVLPHFQKWGATGLLVEYEDVFPYKAKYEVLRAKNSYSEADIKRFLEAATANDLIVIPLVQTFGHLEFVLKHKEFAHLRETEHFTNSLCPNNKESVPMVLGLIDQVLALHPGVKWFHIGGDEVWNIKTCSVCQKDARNKSELFVHHMTPILTHLKNKQVTPVMWDDMMRNWPVEYLKELGPLVEPMVWAYASDLTGYYPPDMWQRYGEAFKTIWAASAFKGATHPWSNFVPIGFHVKNNLNWLNIISKLPATLQVNGIALTGWSRYDHYATLCELLPAALPSVAYCLQTLTQGNMDEELIKSTAKELGLPEEFRINQGRFNDLYHPPNGTFPGHEIFTLVGHLEKAVYDTRGVANLQQGWMLDREVESKFLSYFQVESAYNKTVHGLKILTALQSEAERVLGPVYDDSVIKEWVKDKLDGGVKHFNSLKPQLEELRKVAAGEEGKQ